MGLLLIISIAVLAVCACGDACALNEKEVGEILSRLEALEEIQRVNQAEIQTLRKTIDEQKYVNSKQSVEIKSLKEDNVNLRETQQHQNKKFQRITKLVASLLRADRDRTPERKDNNHIDDTRSSSSDPNLVERSTKVKAEKRDGAKDEIRQNVSKRQATAIAFTVYSSHDLNSGSHQILKYNKVLTAEGPGYSTNTGIFTCPVAGLYMFFFSVGEENAHLQIAGLMVNGNNIIDAVVNSDHHGQYAQGSNMALVRLAVGDVVWVESLGDGGQTAGSTVRRLTTFTGILLTT